MQERIRIGIGTYYIESLFRDVKDDQLDVSLMIYPHWYT